MKTRNFKIVGFIILIGITIGMALYANPSNKKKDLISVMGASPADMYKKGMEAMGGLGNFVKEGDIVVIKPNILLDATPEQHLTTNPGLLKTIVAQCYEAGARLVTIFEHTESTWTKCYKNSGIERAGKDAGARVSPANHRQYYTEVTNDKAQNLKNTELHKALAGANVLINLAVANTKNGGFSGAIKNLWGCVWDKNSYHKLGMENCLAEFLYYKKPKLNITEFYAPDGGSELIISEDIVASDSYIFLKNNKTVPGHMHISIAQKLGFGKLYPSVPNHKKIKW